MLNKVMQTEIGKQSPFLQKKTQKSRQLTNSTDHSVRALAV